MVEIEVDSKTHGWVSYHSLNKSLGSPMLAYSSKFDIFKYRHIVDNLFNKNEKMKMMKKKKEKKH